MRADSRRDLQETYKIPANIIDHAQAAKFLHHCGNGTAFLGLDAERSWALAAWLHPRRADGPPQLMDKSDPTVPPVFFGDPEHIVLCSDGITALRALTEADRQRRALPTVITLYGPDPRSILRTLPPELRDLVATKTVSAFGVANNPSVFAEVDRIRRTYAPQNYEPDPESPEYDPDGLPSPKRPGET